MLRPTLLTMLLASTCLLANTGYLRASLLSSNLDQPVDATESVDPSTLISTSFGSGNYSSNLQDVELLVDLSGQVTPKVWLYSDLGGQPGSPIGSLNPVQLPQGFGLALFSGPNFALSPNSTYWIVAGSSSGSWDWEYAQTSLGTGPGFQHTWGVSLDRGQDWFTSNSQPMMMSVSDTAAPEPDSFALCSLGALASGLILKLGFKRVRQ